jgi:hypothetical protein
MPVDFVSLEFRYLKFAVVLGQTERRFQKSE